MEQHVTVNTFLEKDFILCSKHETRTLAELIKVRLQDILSAALALSFGHRKLTDLLTN